MVKENKQNLFIRLSHLILIKILFIFAALTLVFFYPQKGNYTEEYYSRLKSEIDHNFQVIENELENWSDSGIVQLAEYNFPADATGKSNYYEDISLLYMDRSENQVRSKSLTGFEKGHSWESSNAFLAFAPLLAANTEDAINLAIMDHNGRHIVYYYKPAGQSYALMVTVPNDIEKAPRQHLAYILMILFLCSTLLSLLIIALMRRGLEVPLNNLINGFKKLSTGEQVQIKDQGDKTVRELIGAFNGMSENLFSKQNELEGANEKLTNTNKSLAESEAILTALVDFSPEAIIVTDINDKVILYNHEAAKDFGFEQTDMRGIEITRFIPVPSTDLKNTIVDKDTPAVTKEVICRTNNGNKFPALLVRTPLGLDGNKPMAILHFVKNISESSNYQEMILKLDRIATRGKMARDIAHEINNYLAVLQGNLELIPLFLANNSIDKLEQKIEVMRETVRKVTNFTEGLSRFSDENTTFAKEDLNQLIENLIAFLKPQNLYDHVTISTVLSEDIPLVEIDSGQIQILLANLISNSAEAMEAQEAERLITVKTATTDNPDQIMISVEDNGGGIDKKYLEGLFVKRFSTKREGTGLGLITCYNIISTHNGEIKYDRSDQDGSKFKLYLPVSRKNKEVSEDTLAKSRV